MLFALFPQLARAISSRGALKDGLELLGFQLSWRKGSSGRKYPRCEPSAKSAHKLREAVSEETARDTLWKQPEEVIQGIRFSFWPRFRSSRARYRRGAR
jgi:hypothetical protein